MLSLYLAGLLLLFGLILVSSFVWALLLTRLVTGFAYSIRVSKFASLCEIGQVTAIVPMRNEINNVEGCLTSLLSDLAVAKIIVVDDNSNDGTQDAVRRYCHNKHVELLGAPELQKG